MDIIATPGYKPNQRFYFDSTEGEITIHDEDVSVTLGPDELQDLFKLCNLVWPNWKY